MNFLPENGMKVSELIVFIAGEHTVLTLNTLHYITMGPGISPEGNN